MGRWAPNSNHPVASVELYFGDLSTYQGIVRKFSGPGAEVGASHPHGQLLA